MLDAGLDEPLDALPGEAADLLLQVAVEPPAGVVRLDREGDPHDAAWRRNIQPARSGPAKCPSLQAFHVGPDPPSLFVEVVVDQSRPRRIQRVPGVRRVAVIIPARFGASRLPGKPLADIHGKPLVAHVVERARRARGVDVVVVATDDERIAGPPARPGPTPS